MAFKIKDGLRIGTVDVFNNSGTLLVNAPTATVLYTPRNINNVSFDGSANITIQVPVSTGITGLGTGVASALAVNTGSTGAFVLYNGGLGTPTSGTLTYATGLPISTGVSGLGTGVASALAVNTGSTGAFVLYNGDLGTPTSGTLTYATGLPISTGVSGLGTGVATFLGTPSSSNLRTAVTSTTGTGALVFGTSPTFTTSILLSGSGSGNTTVQASSTASGTLTLPATTDTLIGKATSDTLTNKTYDTAATGNVFKINGTQVSAVTGSGSVVLGTSPTFTTSILLSGSGSGNTTIQASSTASGTLTLPATTDTLIGKATSDTLTNKTYDTAATGNVFKINGTQVSAVTGSGSVVLSTSPAISTSITTGSTSFDLVNTTATTVNFAGAATTLNVGNASGTVYIAGNLDVKGTTTTIESTTLTVTDKNVELGKVTTPTDTTADGGGLILHGTTDKTFNWYSATGAWTSSENLSLASGKAYYINGTSVLSSSTLGSGVTSSSLTSVGTISSGTWHGNTIGIGYGGTGLSSTPTDGQLLIGNSSTNSYNISTLTAGTGISITNGNGSITVAVTGSGVVNSFQTSLSGLTPSTATSGAVTLAGTLGPTSGGTGVSNGANNTITFTGNYTLGLTLTNNTSVTLPTSGTLSTLAGTETLTNKSFNSSVNYQTGGTTIFNENAVQAVLATPPTTSGTAVSIDTWNNASPASSPYYKSVKYIVEVTQGTNYQISELVVLTDGTATYQTEYGVIQNNGDFCTFTTSISSGVASLNIYFTSGSTAATINIKKTLFVK